MSGYDAAREQAESSSPACWGEDIPIENHIKTSGGNKKENMRGGVKI